MSENATPETKPATPSEAPAPKPPPVDTTWIEVENVRNDRRPSEVRFTGPPRETR